MNYLDRAAGAAPPHVWFGVSAVFHYLGPSFAVLLFPAVGVLGVAWFRIVSAALFFAPATAPFRTMAAAGPAGRRSLLALGVCLAAMNTCFYLALARLPMSLVAAMEFVGAIAIALYGVRTRRNAVALLLAAVGVFVLIDVRWSTDPIGLLWSAANAALFVGYVVLGHRAAAEGAGGGVQHLGAAMVIAAALVTPIGLTQAVAAASDFRLVLAGVAVGLCSSVVPYVCDQLAMSRLPRASFALLLALLPAVATLVAALVLSQVPSLQDIAGVGLVMAGVAIHQAKPSAP